MTSFQAHTNNFSLSFSLKLEQYIKDNYFPKFTLYSKFDWSPSRVSSRGGIYKEGPGINMAMHPFTKVCDKSITYRFYEYASYDSNNYIGGFYFKDYKHKLKALLAHEIAHAVQFYDYKINNFRDTPHGPVFKKYYKILRTTFVNNDLENQEHLKNEYNSLIASINKGYK